MTGSNNAALVPASDSLLDAAPPVLVELLAQAGITINGNQPWDIQIKDEAAYDRVLTKGALGFGEAYVEGLWDCERPDELITRLLRHNVHDSLRGWARLRLWKGLLTYRLFQPRFYRSLRQGVRHRLEPGARLFETMLDPSMSYSSAYWASAITLEQAQKHKLDMICKKLQLKEGEWLLDIGCNWGGLAQYAAEHYGVAVTGITSSPEQLQHARKRCAGLPVNIELLDYRELNGCFDKIACIGMLEQEQPANYAFLFDNLSNLLSDQGLLLLQTIGSNANTHHCDPWFDKYILPERRLLSAMQLTSSIEKRFVIEDWHSLGHDYDRTLMSWWENFEAAWPQLRDEYDESFYRMCKYYLHSCAGLFRSRRGHLWQLVMSKPQRRHHYRSLR
jgi:cyclopropane-fatty-acyl-phospholipid synthase